MTDRYYPDIVDDNLEMQQAIQRVRELHSPIQDKFVVTLSWCFSCEQDYPCPTIKALDGEQ